MARFITRRLLLSLITIWILVTIVFVIANVLPNDVGRTILGPFAPQESVDALNEKLGTNRPLIVQYLDTHPERRHARLRRTRYVNDQPVLPQLVAAIGRSAKLAGLALAHDRPPRHRGRAVRRAAARSADRSGDRPARGDLVVDPGVRDRHDPCRGRRGRPQALPVLATPPPNAGILTQVQYLLMPATAMAIVYFGYIARMTRAGTIEVLQSDYTRTATMKGLDHQPGDAQARPAQRPHPDGRRHRRPGRLPVRRHHRGREDLQLPRDGPDDALRRPAQGHPDATAGVIVIGIVYMLATLVADMTIAWMNPRIRLDAEFLMDVIVEPTRRPHRWPRQRPPSGPQARRETCGPAPAARLHHRQHRHHRLDRQGRPRRADHAVRSVQLLRGRPPATEPRAPVGTDDSAGTCCRGSWPARATCSRSRRWRRCSGSSPGRSSG